VGKDARIRRARREARELGLNSSTSAFASSYEQEHPGSMVLGASAQEKMSDVLRLFAEPLLEGVDSPEEFEKALLIATIAWNCSLVDDPMPQSDALRSLFADPETRDMFNALIAQKRELYPDNERTILDFQIIPSGDQVQINVISSVPGPRL